MLQSGPKRVGRLGEPLLPGAVRAGPSRAAVVAQAIDLSTRRIVWVRPAGPTRDMNVLSLHTDVPFPTCIFSMGGNIEFSRQDKRLHSVLHRRPRQEPNAADAVVSRRDQVAQECAGAALAGPRAISKSWRGVRECILSMRGRFQNSTTRTLDFYPWSTT